MQALLTTCTYKSRIWRWLGKQTWLIHRTPDHCDPFLAFRRHSITPLQWLAAKQSGIDLDNDPEGLSGGTVDQVQGLFGLIENESVRDKRAEIKTSAFDDTDG